MYSSFSPSIPPGPGEASNSSPGLFAKRARIRRLARCFFQDLLGTTENDLAPLLEEAARVCRELSLPINGVITDGQRSVRKAVASAFLPWPNSKIQLGALAPAVAHFQKVTASYSVTFMMDYQIAFKQNQRMGCGKEHAQGR